MVVALLVVILEAKLMEAQDQLVTIKWRLIWRNFSNADWSSNKRKLCTKEVANLILQGQIWWGWLDRRCQTALASTWIWLECSIGNRVQKPASCIRSLHSSYEMEAKFMVLVGWVASCTCIGCMGKWANILWNMQLFADNGGILMEQKPSAVAIKEFLCTAGRAGQVGNGKKAKHRS